MGVTFFPPLPPVETDYDALHRWLLTENLQVSRLTAGTLAAGITVTGDLYSDNWDGDIPISLPDTGATAGFALDSSLGVGQFSGTLYASGFSTFGKRMELGGYGATPSVSGDVSTVGVYGGYVNADTSINIGLRWEVAQFTDPGTVISDWRLVPDFTGGFSSPGGITMKVDSTILMEWGGNDVYSHVDHHFEADAKGPSGGSIFNWSTWSPTYANLTVGNGTVVARYIRIGDTVHATYSLTFGTTTSITGTPTISMPVAATSSTPNDTIIGSANLREVGTALRLGAVYKASTTTFGVYAQTAGSTHVRLANLSSTVPFTWGDTDYIRFTATYEAA